MHGISSLLIGIDVVLHLQLALARRFHKAFIRRLVSNINDNVAFRRTRNRGSATIAITFRLVRRSKAVSRKHHTKNHTRRQNGNRQNDHRNF